VSQLGKQLFEVFSNPKQALIDLGNAIKDNLMNRFEGLLELIPKLGEAISLLFEGEFTEAGKTALDAVTKVTLGVEDFTDTVTEGVGQSIEFFKDLGNEIVADTQAAIALEKALNAVIVQERELRVRRAEATAEIEKQKFIAEDTTKTFEERLVAAQKAFELEQEIVDAQVKNEQERLRILEEQAALSDSSEETLEAIANQRVKVAELEASSATRQIELNNKINSIKREQQALIEANAAAEAEAARKAEEAEKKAADEREKIRKKEEEERKKAAEEEIALQEAIATAKVDITSNTLGVIEGFTKEGSDLQKAVGVAQATIDTYKAANNALATVPAPFNFAAAAVAVAAGLANVNKILSVDTSGGNVSAPSVSAPQNTQISTPSVNIGGGNPQLDQIAQSINNNNNNPAKAYVVSTDVTSQQELDRKVKMGATFG
jgi:membrane protein involved in colicin uptake